MHKKKKCCTPVRRHPLCEKMICGLIAAQCLILTCFAAGEVSVPQSVNEPEHHGGFVTEQVLSGADGDIHYSYYLPENYRADGAYPLVVAMPGYDMMWFGEQSSGSNLNWNGFLAWTELDEDMIVVSAQLTDWGEKSARQAIELTEYFVQNFAVDKDRIYAAGYSAGGETMSRAVSMRPDLYAAYLHGASQWDGTYAPLAEQQVAVYIFMAEHDEYYGSQKARDAYRNLTDAYREAGVEPEIIERLLRLEIPGDDYFNGLGIYNYHSGGNVLFDDENILNWILSAQKSTGSSQTGTGFADVAADAWYAEAVEYVRDNGLMSGTSTTTFAPNDTMTRSMLATTLYREAGSPAVSGSDAFTDTQEDAWYADAVLWASQEGVISGYGNGLFGTNDPVSREQIATILWRYAGSPSADAGQDFADESEIASYAVAAVDWARANGVVNGADGNRFLPRNSASRAEVAVMLCNYLTQK